MTNKEEYIDLSIVNFMKILAYYLPQFHEIEENNKWWGKGFTEWENLKKNKSLFKGHMQPIIPLNNNYYNLLKKETMIWQTELLNKYKIYGFCYYHYWFKGKKVMKKPLENLMNWILDERYIKIENKPIFVIYNPYEIENMEKMVKLWEEECKKIGFSGLHIIKTLSNVSQLKESKNEYENFLIREGSCSFSDLNIFQKIIRKLKTNRKKNFLGTVLKYDYEKIMKKSLKISNKYSKKNVYPGIFTGWDNTPRYGNRGYICKSTTELFKKYLLEQKKIMKEREIEYIFLNAWNEWTEGMYLEPDEENKYGYLDIIKEVIEKEV